MGKAKQEIMNTATRGGRRAPKTELDIRMLERGVTQQAIADTLRIRAQSVNRVVRGKQGSAPVITAIAKAVGWSEARVSRAINTIINEAK